MRLLLIVDVYPPEVSSAAVLIHELSHGFRAEGHEVSVVTTFPRQYLSGEEKNALPEVSEENGVKVIRVKTLPLRKVNFIIRGISQLLLPFLVYRKIRKYVSGELDGVIVYSPPLTLAFAGKWAKRRYGGKFILNLWDIFPQNAIDLNILRSKLAIAFFEFLEHRAYRYADVLSFHSEAGRKFLIEKKEVPEGKIFSLPHWIDFASYEKPQKRDFRKEFGLEKKKVFLFAGIMGPAQGLEFLIDVAREIKDIPEVVFLLVGDGMEKEKLQSKITEYGLQNVVMKNFISTEEYPDLVKSADAGIVCLSPKNKTSFVPGKFMGYMAAGKPVLAFLNRESDGFGLVRNSECGVVVEAGKLEEAVLATRKLCTMPEGEFQKLGKNGFEYAKNHLSLASAIGIFHKFLGK